MLSEKNLTMFIVDGDSNLRNDLKNYLEHHSKVESLSSAHSVDGSMKVILVKSKPAGEAGDSPETISPLPIMSYPVDESPESLGWLIDDFLRKLGLQSSLISTKCVRAAIEVGLKAGKNNRLSMMDIYEQVGQVFTPTLSTAAVGRNMRSVAARALKNRTPYFEKHFLANNQSINENQLINSTFLWESVDILRRWIADNQ